MCKTQVYFYETCKCRRSMIHLCDDTQEYKPCHNPEPSLQDVRHRDLRCPYHRYLYQNPDTVSVPKSKGRIISTSGRTNESADAERQEQEWCHGCDTMTRDASSGCQAYSQVVVWYFSTVEECAGRVTVGKHGIKRRHAMDGVDVAVKKVPLSTICPRPPPMPKPTGA
uniref:A-kinase anchor protein 6 n=1 Tax=Talaromyces marneffei PM1 TaxID=1077442 RepID=A0A093UVA9_TALMA